MQTFLGGGFANVVGTNHVRNVGLSGAYGVSGQHFQVCMSLLECLPAPTLASV